MTKEEEKSLITKVEEQIKSKIVDVKMPPQGMDSDVFFVTDSNKNEYVIKKSENSICDVIAYRLLEENNIEIPVPKVFGHFEFEGKTVVILEKVTYPLLESTKVEEMGKYIPSMVENLKKIHLVKSERAGLLTDDNETRNWKELLLAIFDGTNIDWQEVSQRKGVDGELIKNSVRKMIEKIKNMEFTGSPYSLLHTDFNQRNLFVNPENDQIASIIDWGEAMFGDPIYDFGRVRMYIWHFNLSDDVLENYNKILNLNSEQKKLEDLYWLSRVIEYLAYYSEELDEFNTGRIKLHQDFLRNYNWEE